METFETFARRASIRSYTGELPSADDIAAVIGAAQASPAARGKYENIHLTVISNPEVLERIDRNGAAFIGNPSAHPLYGAPVMIVASAKVPGGPGDNPAYSDAAIVVHQMCLAATALGLGSCCIWSAAMALELDKNAKDLLGLPDGFTVCCALTLGPTDKPMEKRTIPADRIKVDYLN